MRKMIQALLPLALLALVAAVPQAAMAKSKKCSKKTLGVERTITLPRTFAAYGTAQHAPLDLKPGEVVLTFDDGPNPELTPRVLKALADQCTKASFFLVGQNINANPELTKSIAKAGHTTAIHSFTHPHLGTLTPEAQTTDLANTEAAYKAVFGVAAPAYRFPFLEETPTMMAALEASKTTVMSIDLAIDDWQPADTTDILVGRLVERLKAKGSGIILMHDANPPTAAAITALLKALKDNGYKVVHVKWEG